MDRSVSLTTVAATALWSSTFLLILAGTLVGLSGGDRHSIMLALIAHGLAMSAGAATVSIRQMFKRQNSLLRDAFEMGRDSQGTSQVRAMR